MPTMSASIPAAALSNPDADLLAAQLTTGEGRCVFASSSAAALLPDETSANVVAEVRGREAPDEIVLLAAHLDSWDLGTGAMDDGAGCAIVSETGAFDRRLAATAAAHPADTLDRQRGATA